MCPTQGPQFVHDDATVDYVDVTGGKRFSNVFFCFLIFVAVRGTHIHTHAEKHHCKKKGEMHYTRKACKWKGSSYQKFHIQPLT